MLFTKTSLFFVISAMSANAQIAWQGSKFAATGTSSSETALSNSGAQFLYDKLTTKASDAPLVTVSLVNDAGLSIPLQTGFDTISQTCSCYYVDSSELATRFGSQIQAARSYRIMFQSEDKSRNFQAYSGYFAILTGGAQLSSLPAPTGPGVVNPSFQGSNTPSTPVSSGTPPSATKTAATNTSTTVLNPPTPTIELELNASSGMNSMLTSAIGLAAVFCGLLCVA